MGLEQVHFYELAGGTTAPVFRPLLGARFLRTQVEYIPELTAGLSTICFVA